MVKRKTVEEEEECKSRTPLDLKTLVRTEAKKECEVTLEVVELAEMEVDEEEVEWRTEGEAQFQEEGGDLDPEQDGKKERLRSPRHGPIE